MKPSRHAAASFALGMILWFFTKSFYASLLCFVTGILVDVDHIIEYTVHYGFKDFSIKSLYKKSTETDEYKGTKGYTKLYLIFHSNELMIILWVITI